MKNTFAVVIPSMGRPSVCRSVRSVLEQTRKPEEMFVVDNGPLGTDVAELLLQAGIQDERLAVLRLPPYSGPSFPRNFGAWNASSSYVCFLDDDDMLAPTYLEAMDHAVAGSGADLLFGTKVFLDPDGRVVRENLPSSVPPSRWLESLLEGRNPGVGGQNMVVKRLKFLEVGGFPPGFTSGEDRQFAITALTSGFSLGLVDDAVVDLSTPDGPRLSGRLAGSVDGLRLLLDRWSLMSWRARYRHSRMLLARTLRKMRQRRSSSGASGDHRAAQGSVRRMR